MWDVRRSTTPVLQQPARPPRLVAARRLAVDRLPLARAGRESEQPAVPDWKGWDPPTYLEDSQPGLGRAKQPAR